jgi:hypothetical protein
MAYNVMSDNSDTAIILLSYLFMRYMPRMLIRGKKMGIIKKVFSLAVISK